MTGGRWHKSRSTGLRRRGPTGISCEALLA
jgi:hypothetical protein